jgi:hypothetical protein
MEGGGASYIQHGRVPRDASVGSSRKQGLSVPSSESSERVNEVRVGAVTVPDVVLLLHPQVVCKAMLAALFALKSRCSVVLVCL